MEECYVNINTVKPKVMMSVNSAILGYGYGVECHALSTIFQLYRGGQFYWWRKPQACRKSLNDISSTPRLSGIQTRNIRGDRH
jgi:hypothetical protein